MHAFNITLIQPENYSHAQALTEIAHYLYDCIGKCGHRVQNTRNYISGEQHNVIIGAHLMQEEHLPLLGRNTIVFNSEQLGDAGAPFATELYRRIINSHFVWDYSCHNLAKIGHDWKVQIPFFHCAALKRSDLRRRAGDALLFYGALSERRKNILVRLHESGVAMRVLFDVYGDARDAEMFNCWAVLNLHQSDERQLFAPVRCFYPLINRIPVISEPFCRDPLLSIFEQSMFVTGAHTLVEDIVALYRARGDFERKAEHLVETFARSNPIPHVRDALAKYLDFFERRPGGAAVA